MSFIKEEYSFDELWRIPKTSEDRFEMIRTYLPIWFSEKYKDKNIRHKTFEARFKFAILTATEALDIPWNIFINNFANQELPKGIDEVIKMLDFLCLDLSFLDLGYNPLRHRLQILKMIKEKKTVPFFVTPKLYSYLVSLYKFELQQDISFKIRHYGGDLLRATLWRTKLISSNEINNIFDDKNKLELILNERIQNLSSKCIQIIERSSKNKCYPNDLLSLQ